MYALQFTVADRVRALYLCAEIKYALFVYVYVTAISVFRAET
jgi:hypothetical protein